MLNSETAASRKFGVSLVGDIPWGTHLCQFYETKQDLIDILVPYFAEGLASNEFCMWVTSPPLEVLEAKQALAKAVPNLDMYLGKGQIEIISYNDWYLLGGKFDCDRVLQGWVEKEENALKHGFEGLRLTGNTFWVERNLWKSFVNYEEAVNRVIGEHKMLALCTYCLSNCSGTDVLDVVRNHVGTLLKQGDKWSLVEDVLHRKKAEQDVIQLASFPLLNPNPIAEVDFDCKVQYANPAAKAMFSEPLVSSCHPLFSDLEKIIKALRSGKNRSITREVRVGETTFLQNLFLVPNADRVRFYAVNIDNLKRAENALRESEQRWETTLSSIGDAVIATDTEGCVTFLNSVAEKLTGWSLTDASSKPLDQIFNIVNEQTRMKAEGPVSRVLKEGMVVGLANHTILLKKDGSEVPIDDSGAPIKDKDGNITGVVLVFRDITERKKAEEKLRVSEENYHSLFSNMMDGFAFCKMIFDEENKPIDFVYLEINNAFERITGLKRENVVGKKVTKAIPGIRAANPELFEIYGRVALSCQDEKFEIFFKPLGMWLSVSVYCPAKGYFAAIFEDVTERKKSESALRESEVKFRTVSNFTYDWEYWVAPDGKLAYTSPSCERITGYSADEFIKDPSLLTKIVHPDDKKLVAGHFDLVDSKELHDVDFRIITRNGEIRWISHACQAVFDDEGKWLGRRASNRDISERKRAELEAWRAKNDWERTFDTVPDFIAILDEKHRIVRANKSMAQQLGVKPEQAIGLPCYTCVHGTSLPPEFCPHAKTLEDGKEHVAEVHEPRLGGDFIVSTTPLKDEKGRTVGSVHVARNITERKRAEEALSKLNRHLRAISNSNQALMHAVDETSFTQEVCDIIIKDCGYALVWVGFAEHDKAKTVRPIAYAGFDKSYIDGLKVTWDAKSERGHGPTGTTIRTGKPYICKNLQTDPNFAPWRKNAIERNYTASCVLPLSSQEGETFGALNIYSKEPNPFTDEEVNLLTELANDFAYGVVMLRLRKEREEAEETLQKQASLIDLSPDAIIVRKLDGTISLWSKGAEKLYGWKKDEAIGRKTHQLLKTSFPESILEIEQQIKQKGKWQGELLHQTKDQRQVVVQSYWLATRNEQGEISELLESNVDVTDRMQMQEKLEEYAAHLEEIVQERTQQLKDAERLTAIGETAGMVGHDLRNPLQTVTGETFLAKDELKSLPDSQEKRNLEENVTIIAEQISYMDKIVSDLQDFVRPISPDKKPVDLKKLLTATLAQVNLPENIDAQTQIEKDLPEVQADIQLLKRVFFNLFTNAVQAMPEGGKLTVKAHAKKTAKENGTLIIDIEDTGVGIPESVKQKIFRPLFTTKSKGQGFGLAVCRRVIEAHGGTVTFESQEGKGSRFTVELPF